jgi:hypothetical protein
VKYLSDLISVEWLLRKHLHVQLLILEGLVLNFPVTLLELDLETLNVEREL